jgi:hypothetical protein
MVPALQRNTGAVIDLDQPLSTHCLYGARVSGIREADGPNGPCRIAVPRSPAQGARPSVRAKFPHRRSSDCSSMYDIADARVASQGGRCLRNRNELGHFDLDQCGFTAAGAFS